MEEKLRGLQFFLDGIWGPLKCQRMRMTLGGSFLQNDFKYQKNSQLLLKKFPRKS